MQENQRIPWYPLWRRYETSEEERRLTKRHKVKRWKTSSHIFFPTQWPEDSNSLISFLSVSFNPRMAMGLTCWVFFLFSQILGLLFYYSLASLLKPNTQRLLALGTIVMIFFTLKKECLCTSCIIFICMFFLILDYISLRIFTTNNWSRLNSNKESLNQLIEWGKRLSRQRQAEASEKSAD
jgi:hypothetical protein